MAERERGLFGGLYLIRTLISDVILDSVTSQRPTFSYYYPWEVNQQKSPVTRGIQSLYRGITTYEAIEGRKWDGSVRAWQWPEKVLASPVGNSRTKTVQLRSWCFKEMPMLQHVQPLYSSCLGDWDALSSDTRKMLRGQGWRLWAGPSPYSHKLLLQGAQRGTSDAATGAAEGWWTGRGMRSTLISCVLLV